MNKFYKVTFILVLTILIVFLVRYLQPKKEKSNPEKTSVSTSSKSVNLSGKRLTNVPVDMLNGSVTKMDLSNNELETLPSQINSWTNLTQLNLSNNKLRSIPAEIGQIQKLTVLDV